MDPIQTAFHDEADTLATRATRLVLAFATRGMALLRREVRGLRTRVRLWLTELAKALPVLPPLEARQKREKGNRKPGATKRPGQRQRFGLTLVSRIPNAAPPGSNAPPSAEKAKAKTRAKADPIIALGELVFALHDLQRTIADPRAALDHIARKLRKPKPAAQPVTESEINYPPQTDNIAIAPDQFDPARVSAADTS